MPQLAFFDRNALPYQGAQASGLYWLGFTVFARVTNSICKTIFL